MAMENEEGNFITDPQEFKHLGGHKGACGGILRYENGNWIGGFFKKDLVLIDLEALIQRFKVLHKLFRLSERSSSLKED
ncbi:hypothetical protein JHK85_010997 [Glycine max]|nr:hypothetical protein JHK85_010997 [Glycine max]KAG5066959.1 hypothetical protein JHK86_010690 [Glycine max]